MSKIEFINNTVQKKIFFLIITSNQAQIPYSSRFPHRRCVRERSASEFAVFRAYFLHLPNLTNEQRQAFYSREDEKDLFPEQQKLKNFNHISPFSDAVIHNL